MSLIKGDFSHVDLIVDIKRYIGETGVRRKYDIDKENYTMIFKLNKQDI